MHRHSSCEVLEWLCSGEEKSKSGWQAVTIKKRVIEPWAMGLIDDEAAALQEKAALLAVKDALQTVLEPHHIVQYLDCYRHTDVTDGLERMY